MLYGELLQNTQPNKWYQKKNFRPTSLGALQRSNPRPVSVSLCPSPPPLLPEVWGNVSYRELSVTMTLAHTHTKVLWRVIFFFFLCLITPPSSSQPISAWAISDTANFHSQTNTSRQTVIWRVGERTRCNWLEKFQHGVDYNVTSVPFFCLFVCIF